MTWKDETKSAGRRELLVRVIRIEVTAGVDLGKSIEIDSEITVGKDPSASLVLTDPMVSRLHFAIRPETKGWLISDLDSTNGVMVNNVRVLNALVGPGQVITIGNTTLQLLASQSVTAIPLSEGTSWERALGTSPAMRQLFAVLPRIAAHGAVVLLEGETGTGKTLLAHAIHSESGRSKGPFIVLDCGAIVPTLIESELFGHEKGAFTGASARRVGAFELAQGGTVFLDEIGELPLDLQPKLLRALEERAIRRVGGTEDIALDVRVIAATNRDLRAAVNHRTFRSDLYFRLNTIRIRVPPLRERREDIPLLAEHFWRIYALDESPVPDEFLAALQTRDWPGNVRELRSTIERAILLGERAALEIESVEPDEPDEPVDLVEGQPFRLVKDAHVARWERAYIRTLIDRHAGNISKAARAARMDRNYLRSLLRRHWPADYDDT